MKKVVGEKAYFDWAKHVAKIAAFDYVLGVSMVVEGADCDINAGVERIGERADGQKGWYCCRLHDN